MKCLGVALVVVASLSAGCGEETLLGPTDDGDGDGDVGDAAPDADVPPTGWANLIGRSWSVPPGSADTYKCTRIEVPEDMWVAGFRAIAPLGTHHTVVTISTRATPLGDYDCSVSNLDPQMLYASGVATDDLLFPEGVAMRLRKGQFINLNLHLFNASDNEIAGTSGIMIKTIPADEVVHEADMMFAGSQRISVPSDGEPHTVEGGCEASEDWNVFALWPHMHQFATHAKFVVTPQGGAAEVVLDNPFSFQEQVNYPQVARTIESGSRIDVSCTYVNDSGSPVTFGDSSNQEMCFIGMYKYPAGGHLFGCVEF